MALAIHVADLSGSSWRTEYIVRTRYEMKQVKRIAIGVGVGVGVGVSPLWALGVLKLDKKNSEERGHYEPSPSPF